MTIRDSIIFLFNFILDHLPFLAIVLHGVLDVLLL